MTNFSVMAISAVSFALLAVIFAGVWVYKDAKQRGLQAGMWALIVVLGGNFIGLILYLLIGRKQERAICNHCGAATNNQGTFCSACGERITVQNHIIKTNNHILFACITCILLVFVSLGLCLHSYLTADGFSFARQYSYYRYSSNGSVKNTSQRSSGNTWDLSYDKASGGYTFAKTYNASSKPLLLSIDIQCGGTVQLIITQNGVTINETIGEGSFNYDMSIFEPGKINMKIINIDASNFSGKIVVEAQN